MPIGNISGICHTEKNVLSKPSPEFRYDSKTGYLLIKEQNINETNSISEIDSNEAWKPLGKIGITYQGEYNLSLTYEQSTIIRYADASWISVQDVPAHNEPSEDSDYWQLLSKDGTILTSGDNISITENETGTHTISANIGTKIMVQEEEPEDKTVLWGW